MPDAHILIVNPRDLKVLLLKQQVHWTLPVFPGNERHSEVNGITQAIRKQLGLRVHLLHCIQDHLRVYAAENLSANITPLNGRWFSKEELGSLDSEHSKLLAKHSIGKLLPITPPWARIGWFEKAEKWILEKLEKKGTPATGPIEHVKVWGLSCILRVPTDQGWAWFKAVPPVFSREPGLVRHLNKRYPGSVPRVISTNSGKGWLLTRDFGGRALCDFTDPAYWATVLKSYAQLQQEEVPYAKQLAIDLVIRGGLDRLESWASLLTESSNMATQGLIPETAAKEWGRIVPAIKQKCRQLAAYKIPETLEHGDLYCGNININDDGVVFFDWTDGSISHPFFSLDPFLNECEFSETDKEHIVSSYLKSWATYLGRDIEDITAAWELAKPLALVHQTVIYFRIKRSLQPEGRWQIGNSPENLLRKTIDAFKD
ncbi:MAG: hypothetical protein FH749_09770 [Firmicutes bacterium]|nr:hypothetical protein [Bacillota bacterium]